MKVIMKYENEFVNYSKFNWNNNYKKKKKQQIKI